jgi:capsular exopolysaccharide synthesis family protein
MSRVYDALRKLDEQKGESDRPATNTFRLASENQDRLLSIRSVQAHIGLESKIVVYTDRRSPGAERFRLIRMALRNFNAGKLLKVLLITSPQAEDGKSTVALNLATSLAEDSKLKVLLLEGDLRRPCLAQKLNLAPACGLAEILKGESESADTIKRVEPLGFYLLPAGTAPEDPIGLLQGEKFSAVLRELRTCFDWILIDSPPIFPLADTVALKAHADGTLLVARAGITQREAVQESIQQIKPGPVIGLILNAVEGVDQLYANYYGRDAEGPGTKSDGLGLGTRRS